MAEIVYSEGNTTNPPDLRLLHFNDVYHVDASSAEPVGGVARFQAVSNHYRSDEQFANQPKLLTLFSGDAFNPSLESSVTKGRIYSLRENHDLDFGVKQFRSLAKQCNFPWLLANVLDPQHGPDVPLGNALKTVMLTASNGIKIGVIGLVEREWLDTINSLPPDLIYKSVSATAKELAPKLREEGAEMIIALTHQREPNDNKLAEKTPDGMIDLVLGGHDHYYQHSIINGTHVLRSGSDFRQLSYIEARRRSGEDQKWDFRIEKRDIVSDITPDENMTRLVEDLTLSLRDKLEKPLGYTASPLDARFATVRLKESNIGNFVCDLMCAHYNGDCALIASGTIRGDQIYPPGVLRLKDIMNCFPFEDPTIAIQVSGAALHAALENSVSAYPALEGRFPQVSNIQLEFDPSAAPHQRIEWVKVGGLPLDLNRRYTVVTRGYMGRGKDGFDSLLVESEGGEAEEIVSEENGILISMMLRQYFMSLKILGKWKHWGKGMNRQWTAIHQDLHKTHPVVEPNLDATKVTQDVTGSDSTTTPLDDSEDEGDHRVLAHTDQLSEWESTMARRVTRKWRRLAGVRPEAGCVECMDDGEFQIHWTRAIAPRLEGRIVMTTPKSSKTESKH